MRIFKWKWAAATTLRLVMKVKFILVYISFYSVTEKEVKIQNSSCNGTLKVHIHGHLNLLYFANWSLLIGISKIFNWVFYTQIECGVMYLHI